MPAVRVSWLDGKDDSAKRAVAAEITESLVRHTGVEANYVYIVFEDVAASDWAVAGNVLSEPPKRT